MRSSFCITDLKVTNFPVPVVSEERTTTYERAFMHRRIELREIQQSHRTTVWPGVTEETNSGTPLGWMVNEGKLSADPDVKTEEQILASGKYSKRRRSNVALIIVKIVFI